MVRAGWLPEMRPSPDPLSSQGILSALYSGLKAAGAVIRVLAGDRDALLQYDVSILKLYTQFRGIDGSTMASRALAGEPVLEDQKRALRTSIRQHTLRLSRSTIKNVRNHRMAICSADAVASDCRVIQFESKARGLEPPDNHPRAPASAAGLPQSAAHSRP